jgi:hypothetical protein
MKHLTITFGLAVGLICAAMWYNKTQSNDMEAGTATIAKTIVETDAEGNVTSELTMVISGNRWVEKSKKEISYAQGCRTELNFDYVNGIWVEVSKVVKMYGEYETLNNEVCYAMSNKEWIEKGNKTYTDLSLDNGLLEDLVFDKDGNLIMSATYEWNDNAKNKGVNKVEYVYDGNGMPCRMISYAWDGESWSKEQVSDILYVSMMYR